MTYTYTYGDRKLVPLSKKMNIIWWFGNDDDPSPPDWYQGSKFMWYLRNPMHNFFSYVIGVCDRNYLVTADFPYGANIPSDTGTTGWWRSTIELPIRLPYWAYSNSYIDFYVGWQPSGRLGVRLTIKNSPLQAY